MNSHTVGSRLREFRRRKGWTQKTLADESGLSPGYVGLLELDSRRPDREKLSQLCKALELSPEETDDIFLAAGYSPSSEETRQALQSFIQERQTASARGDQGPTLLNTGVAATGKPVEHPVTPEVLRPLGPFITNDGKFSITIWREPHANRNFLLIRDLTDKDKNKGKAEGRKIILVSDDPNGQLVAQGYITDRHLALSVDCEIKFPLSWMIKTETQETSKGEAP